MDAEWRGAHYVVKERRFTLGRQYRVFDGSGRLVAYCKQKMMRLREDIPFFRDVSQTQPLFRMQATKVLDFNANLEVRDAQGRLLGILRRKGWKSLLRDEWHVLDAAGRHAATLKEDSGLMAFLRRFVASIIPYRYFLEAPPGSGRAVASIEERFQLFGDTYDLRLQGSSIDPRVLVGLTVLTDALEGQ